MVFPGISQLIEFAVRHVHDQELIKEQRVEDREMLHSYEGSPVFLPLGRVLLVIIIARPLKEG